MTLYLYTSFKKTLLFFLLLLSCFLNVNSQNDSTHTLLSNKDTLTTGELKKIKLNKEYFISYFTDTKEIIIAPFSWKRKQWLTTAALLGTSVLIYTQDEEIYDFIQKNQTKAKDDISKYVFEPFGSGVYTLPLLGVFYVIGASSDNVRAKNIALTGIKAFIISAGFAQVAKQIFHRHRPYQEEPPNSKIWDGPFNSEFKYNSFPSAHSSVVFSIAYIIASGYKDKKWIGIVSYSIAGLTALSRLNDNEHWASDVFCGAVLGTFIGKTIFRNSFNSFELIPYSSLNTYGLSLNISLK